MYCSILIAFEHTINLNFQEFDEVDASQKLVFVTTCTKYLKKYGNHSCQCIFSRSEFIPDGLPQPRVELFLATMNAHTGETVTIALQKKSQRKDETNR